MTKQKADASKMEWIFEEEFHGIRIYHDKSRQYQVYVDCHGNVQEVGEFTGIGEADTYEYAYIQAPDIEALTFPEWYNDVNLKMKGN